MNLSCATFRDLLARHAPSPRYWIAYSGGLDSRVLLHLCSQLKMQRPDLHFTAVHVHHGLQAAADHWADFCRETSGAAGLPFRLIHVDAQAKPGQSPEEAARTARYHALSTLLSDGETLLTAQHRDDQAETLLLQLMRGAGIAGLAAMPEYTACGPGYLLRPLLGFARSELRDYAEAHRLDWIEDPSNRNLAYDRNFIRHEVMPLLARRWPAVAETLSRTAGHCAEALETLDSLAQDLFKTALHPERNTLLADRLITWSEADRRLVLRAWLRANGLRMPAVRVLGEVQKALGARPDRNPIVRWSEGEIRRYRNELYLLPPGHPFDSTAVIPWDGNSVLPLPDGNGELRSAMVTGSGISLPAWRSGIITIRYRHGGETCRPLARRGSHELKKLFQEAGIPPWVRERTPLVYIDGGLAAVGSWWICEPFVGSKDERNIAICWEAPAWCSGAKPREIIRD